jgi:hypothetical protein
MIVAMVDELMDRLRSINNGRAGAESGIGGFDSHLRSLRDLNLTDPGIYVALTEIATRSIRDARNRREDRSCRARVDSVRYPAPGHGGAVCRERDDCGHRSGNDRLPARSRSEGG